MKFQGGLELTRSVSIGLKIDFAQHEKKTVQMYFHLDHRQVGDEKITEKIGQVATNLFGTIIPSVTYGHEQIPTHG